MRISTILRLAAPAIADYAVATADHNPLHCDAAFAATTPFGRPIAHGTLALNALWLAAEAAGRTIEGTTVDVTFIAPAFIDEAVVCEFAEGTDGATGFSILADRRAVITGTLSAAHPA